MPAAPGLRRLLKFVNAPRSPAAAPKPGIDSFSPPLRVRLLILQSTPFCNLDCRYCYLPDRDLAARMDKTVIEATLNNLESSGLLSDRLSVVWHSGEPLVPGPAYYYDAFERIDSMLAQRCAVRHSIQTNGTLINQEWCDLFAQHRVRVGVSVDGPARIHDLHRRTRSGRGSHADVMRGIEYLRRNAYPFHAIAVLTAASLDAADEIFEFFLEAGFTEVGFNIDETEGVNVQSSFSEPDEARFAGFLGRMRELASAAGGRLRIRELDAAYDLVLHAPEQVHVDGLAVPRNSQVLPLEILTVDHAGNVSTFSPELLGQSHPRHRDFVFGNVFVDKLSSVFGNPHFAEIWSEVWRGVELCRARCDYFGLCGGGAPANKLYENGTFASPETRYCRTAMKIPLELELARCEQLFS